MEENKDEVLETKTEEASGEEIREEVEKKISKERITKPEKVEKNVILNFRIPISEKALSMNS